MKRLQHARTRLRRVHTIRRMWLIAHQQRLAALAHPARSHSENYTFDGQNRARNFFQIFTIHLKKNENERRKKNTEHEASEPPFHT